ncbi:MAG: acylphosphatase [Streptococcaceae bacterium]|jgi:acylphosphatase|nr:acylphosphatase [Streptococcaceae bacterium]
MTKVKITVAGTVQGVGFRYNTLKIAKHLGVFGRVWNNDDGTVGIFAQCDEQTLFNFQKRLREGNHWIRVNYLDVEAGDFEDFKDFKVI